MAHFRVVFRKLDIGLCLPHFISHAALRALGGPMNSFGLRFTARWGRNPFMNPRKETVKDSPLHQGRQHMHSLPIPLWPSSCQTQALLQHKKTTQVKLNWNAGNIFFTDPGLIVKLSLFFFFKRPTVSITTVSIKNSFNTNDLMSYWYSQVPGDYAHGQSNFMIFHLEIVKNF